MRMKTRTPLSWKLEEYAFGAVALHEEIRRHKNEDGNRWSIFKEIGIRILLIYAVLVTVVMVIFIMLKNIVINIFNKIMGLKKE